MQKLILMADEEKLWLENQTRVPPVAATSCVSKVNWELTFVGHWASAWRYSTECEKFFCQGVFIPFSCIVLRNHWSRETTPKRCEFLIKLKPWSLSFHRCKLLLPATKAGDYQIKPSKLKFIANTASPANVEDVGGILFAFRLLSLLFSLVENSVPMNIFLCWRSNRENPQTYSEL